MSATIDGAKARVIPGGEDHLGFTLDKELPAGAAKLAIEWTGGIDHEKSRGIYAEKEAGVDYVSYMLAIEAVARASATIAAALVVHNSLVAELVAHVGLAKQKEQYLRRLASGCTTTSIG